MNNVELINKLENEFVTVRDNHDKLLVFIGTDKFYELTVDHQCLLRAQLGAMASYTWIVRERINLLRV